MNYDDNEERAMVTRSEYWGFFGLVLVCFVLGFFFFFYKHLFMTVLEFVLLLLWYRLYWGLVFFAFSASDVIVGLISDSLCWFFFF